MDKIIRPECGGLGCLAYKRLVRKEKELKQALVELQRQKVKDKQSGGLLSEC